MGLLLAFVTKFHQNIKNVTISPSQITVACTRVSLTAARSRQISIQQAHTSPLEYHNYSTETRKDIILLHVYTMSPKKEETKIVAVMSVKS